jgi:hypothetical protein
VILEKMAHAVARQDWSTVLLEIVIVVVGIFIGLQVDDWNEARRDRIDEREFIARLHGEMDISRDFLFVIQARHQNTWENAGDALDVLFSRNGRDELTDEECEAIGRSIYRVPVKIQLPSLEELMATGRLNIVKGLEIRTALARLEQLSESTRSIIDSSHTVFLSTKYPDLIWMEGYWSAEENEIRGAFHCDLVAMRASKGFLSDYSMNADSFDAFYNKGAKLELEQLEYIHGLVDSYLDLRHPE